MQNLKKYNIDNRKKEELLRQIESLAKSYAPDWKFDVENPDIGSVLAILFADQLYGNIKRFNQVLDRYHTEFVNLLDISHRKAHPASAVVLMEMSDENVPGVYVPKKTRLLTEEEDIHVFETSYPVFLTPSKLSTIFQTSSDEGKIIPLKGYFPKYDYSGRLISDEEEESDSGKGNFKPFTLYDFSDEGISRQALILYHSRIFDVENENIFCRIKGDPTFCEKLKAGEYRFLYYTDDGFKPIESVRVMDDENIILVKSEKNKKTVINENEVSMFVIEAVNKQLENRSFTGISFSSSGRMRNPEFVGNGTSDYETERFLPFGDTFSLYSECFVGMDTYFSQKGSKITIEFDLEFDEHYVGYVQTTIEEELKVIKRKERYKVETTIAYTKAQEISIEYYNGIGWKRLACDQEYTQLFANGEKARVSLSFICPKDWEKTTTGAYDGRSIRIMLRKADNCYLQPCIHTYPIISNMQIDYTYEGHFEVPEAGKKLYGTTEADITDKLIAGKSFVAFEKINYNDTALYLGFTRIFEKGPVSLWWKLSNIKRNQERKLHFFYSTTKGFKEMGVIDYTQGLSRSGIMLFLPPEDMAKIELEGKKLCWIKVIQDGTPDLKDSVRIEQISTNAVETRNFRTYEPKTYFIDEVKSNMAFSLPYDDIYDAEVWVNERSELTVDQMQVMLRERPDECRATYNYLGNISEFFVKWEERDNFNNSVGTDRHYCIDRINSLLIFGDGVNVRIPQNTHETAFEVTVRTCSGNAGNVPANSITSCERNILFVTKIYNPEPAYGGSSMENNERAMIRGADLISSGNRFVTEKDYLNEIISYSENIDKASIVIGTDRYGVLKPEMVYIVLLMRDYKNGPTSFYQMQMELRNHLIEHCEMTIVPEELQIEEPVFVELSVDVWAQIVNIEDSFEVSNLVTETLDEYLEPISFERHRGWGIGELPRKAQILIRLNALKSKAIIKQIVVTARYSDVEGYHEVDLEKIRITPFMVVTNGKHKVHISKTGEAY